MVPPFLFRSSTVRISRKKLKNYIMTILIIFGCTTTKRTNDLHDSTEQRKEGFSEKDLLKERNSVIAHNPMSNLKLGSGIAPVSDLLERDINVTVGTDGAISGNDLDMWLSMRLAATLPKGALMKPDILSASPR